MLPRSLAVQQVRHAPLVAGLQLPAVGGVALYRPLRSLTVGRVAEVSGREGAEPLALVGLPAVEAVNQNAAPGHDDRGQPVDGRAVPLDRGVVFADARVKLLHEFDVVDVQGYHWPPRIPASAASSRAMVPSSRSAGYHTPALIPAAVSASSHSRWSGRGSSPAPLSSRHLTPPGPPRHPAREPPAAGFAAPGGGASPGRP